jgi:hypothetical protein
MSDPALSSANEGQCAYCGEIFPRGKLTVDHVIANTWYPTTTPDNTPRWKAPACESCNSKFSKIEQFLLIRLAFCVDPNSESGAGIYERAKKSIDPTRARNKKDRLHRERFREELLRDIQELPDLPASGILSFSEKNWQSGSRTAILISAEKLEAIAKKWAMGIHHALYGKVFSNRATIEVIHLSNDDEQVVRQQLGAFSSTDSRGPGVEVTWNLAENNHEYGVLYQFVIWQNFKVLIHIVDSMAVE